MTALAPLLFGVDWMDPKWLLAHYHSEFFWISMAIVFVECGLFFPILPGDTLLFAVGLFVASGDLHTDLVVSLVALGLAAFAGNVVGYEIGRALGPPLYQRDGRILKQSYLDRTRAFFGDHGRVALVLGRFVPVVRTYITVVAGVTRMERRVFFTWSAVGAALWVLAVTLAGYFLGSAFPSLGENLDKAILGLLALSVIPIGYEVWRQRRSASDEG